MLITPIRKALEQTSLITGESPELVSQVVSDYFKQIESFLKEPTHIGIRLDYIGSFQLNYPGIKTYLKKNLRKNFKEEFRVYWKLRHKAKDYAKSRKFKNYRESFLNRKQSSDSTARAEGTHI